MLNIIGAKLLYEPVCLFVTHSVIHFLKGIPLSYFAHYFAIISVWPFLFTFFGNGFAPIESLSSLDYTTCLTYN